MIIFFDFLKQAFLTDLYNLRIKKNRAPSNLLLINLSLADIFRVSIDIPMVMFSAFKEKWLYGQLGCNIYVLTSGLQSFTVIFTLVVMSVERYLIVKHPLYVFRITKRFIISKLDF